MYDLKFTFYFEQLEKHNVDIYNIKQLFYGTVDDEEIEINQKNC